MSYYYITKEGEFVDSSSRLNDPKYIQINEQEYAITRLVVRGYYRHEIEQAVERVFSILQSAQQKMQPTNGGQSASDGESKPATISG